MAKRFTDSRKFHKPWYRKMPPAMKCFWEYLLAECDIAGVWTPDFEMASFMIGDTIEANTARESMGQQVEILASGKWWIVDYCRYQYGALSEDCRPHRAVIQKLREHGLYQRVCEGLDKGSLRAKDKDKDKEKDKDGGSAEGGKPMRAICTPSQADSIYLAYPRKVGARKAKAAILAAAKRLADKGHDNPVAFLYRQAMAYAESPAGQPPPSRDGPDYRPHPATWFNNDRFDDDPEEWSKPNGGYSRTAFTGKSQGTAGAKPAASSRRAEQADREYAEPVRVREV